MKYQSIKKLYIGWNTSLEIFWKRSKLCEKTEIQRDNYYDRIENIINIIIKYRVKFERNTFIYSRIVLFFRVSRKYRLTIFEPVMTSRDRNVPPSTPHVPLPYSVFCSVASQQRYQPDNKYGRFPFFLTRAHFRFVIFSNVPSQFPKLKRRTCLKFLTAFSILTLGRHNRLMKIWKLFLKKLFFLSFNKYFLVLLYQNIIFSLNFTQFYLKGIYFFQRQI